MKQQNEIRYKIQNLLEFMAQKAKEAGLHQAAFRWPERVEAENKANSLGEKILALVDQLIEEEALPAAP
jgi:hypothetical protein